MRCVARLARPHAVVAAARRDWVPAPFAARGRGALSHTESIKFDLLAVVPAQPRLRARECERSLLEALFRERLAARAEAIGVPGTPEGEGGGGDKQQVSAKLSWSRLGVGSTARTHPPPWLAEIPQLTSASVPAVHVSTHLGSSWGSAEPRAPCLWAIV